MAIRYSPEWKKKIFNTLKSKTPSLPVRLFSNAVEDRNGCWNWQGACSVGYGIITVNRKARKAHRTAWECTYGPIPEGLFVCHSCDNPSCIRPDHLFTMTCLENEIDKYAKGRDNRKRTYTPETRKILSDKLKLQHVQWKQDGVKFARNFTSFRRGGIKTRFKAGNIPWNKRTP